MALSINYHAGKNITRAGFEEKRMKRKEKKRKDKCQDEDFPSTD